MLRLFYPHGKLFDEKTVSARRESRRAVRHQTKQQDNKKERRLIYEL